MGRGMGMDVKELESMAKRCRKLGSGPMKYLKAIPRRAKDEFREGATACWGDHKKENIPTIIAS